MTTTLSLGRSMVLCALALAGQAALAAVSAEEAAALKSALTPFGAEKAGNKDGTIPAWTGGFNKSLPVTKGKPIPDPFAGEKPLFTITAKNMAEHAERLTEGSKALLKKFPDTYKINVYTTHRTALAPQWVYDHTFKNATRAKLENNLPVGAYGGIPFPVPKSGAEVVWNHLLRWRGEAWSLSSINVLVTSEGKQVMQSAGVFENQSPYYIKDGSPEKFNGDYLQLRLVNEGPPIRVGEGVVGVTNVDGDKAQAYVYLTGQRRVRKLPNACCDTPNIPSGGTQNYDDFEVWSGRLDRFNWKILGKKEIYVPYNTNRFMQPASRNDVLGEHHLNPEHLRWELHRVWVVEANLAAGERNTSPKSTYYFDEDTWLGLLADRQDAKGQLWKTSFTLPVVLSEMPGVATITNGFYDLISGVYFAAVLPNEHPGQQRFVQRWKDTWFTAEALSGTLVR